MSIDHLLNGYRDMMNTIYSPKHFYARTTRFLKMYHPKAKIRFHMGIRHAMAVIKSCVRLGIIGKERFLYWKLLLWSAFRRPTLLPLAIKLSIYGYHFRKVFRQHEKALIAAIAASK
jgi:hypothetical protein